MTSLRADTVDLVCGPDGPLPEGRQRYRLTDRIGSGGQADVFRGVRLSNGVRSSPVTIKVFRADQRRQVLDQMRSWDKGDAVLMDLNTRNVAGICLRVDGFYGAPPVRPDTTAVLGSGTDRRIPYQILDYLPGHTLLQHVARQASGQEVPRLDGTAVLTALAGTIVLLHHPVDPIESPVLHMDVKPSNVLVLPSGEVRLIDFTAARYHDPVHITTIAHTPESAGPEAFTGHVGPSYDVHGFGSVAYHLVTGSLPRADRATSHYDGAIVAPGTLRRHPLLDANPVLAAHLLAPLDDNPTNRPLTIDLIDWVAQLAQIAAAIPLASTHVDWRPAPRRAQGAPTTRVESRTQAAPPTKVEKVPTRAGAQPASGQRIASGVAKVVPRQPRTGEPDQVAPPAPAEPAAPAAPAGPVRRRGKGFTTFAVLIAAASWLLWLATVALLPGANTGEPVTAALLVLGGALAAWWLVRLGGHLIRITLDRGPRASTLVQNLVTSGFILLCASVFLARAQANFGDVGAEISTWWSGLWKSLWPF